MGPGLENGGSPLATGTGRTELGLVTGAEQAPQGRLLPWTWPALSWNRTAHGGKWGWTCWKLPSPTADCPLLLHRVFGLLEATQKLVLVAESFHHQRCVLKVEAFLHMWAGGER